MTTPVHPSTHINPPRHSAPMIPQQLQGIQQILGHAEGAFIQALDKLNAEYLSILTLASTNYSNAVDRGFRLYHAIEQPARARYERETKMAEEAARGIIDPAQAEMDKLSQAALEMYERAIRPIEEAYQRAAVQAAAAVVQSTTSPPAQ